MRRRQKTVVLTICGPNVPFEITRGYLQSFGRHVISTRGWKHFSYFVRPDPQSSLSLYLCIDYTRPGCTQSSKSKTSSVRLQRARFSVWCLVSQHVCGSLLTQHCAEAPRALTGCVPLWVSLFHVSAFLFLSCHRPRSVRESRRPLLSSSRSLSQRDAAAYRSVGQNQRCLGNPSRIPAVDQETGKWAVWGSMDGYAKTQLLYY